jgi:hypothetical protein
MSWTPIWEHGLDSGIIGAIANISSGGTLLPPSLQHRSTFNPILRQSVAASYYHTGNYEPTGLGAIHDSHIRPERSGVCKVQAPLQEYASRQTFPLSIGETRYLTLYPRPHNNLLLASIPASTTCTKTLGCSLAALRIAVHLFLCS